MACSSHERNLDSYFIYAFIHVKTKPTKTPVVSTDKISFVAAPDQLKSEVIVTVPIVCLMLFSICQEGKDSQVFISFPFDEPEDYWLFTLAAGLSR